ncbi:MAG: hypothetical protein ACRC46_02470 [Thermoguttaceae bacterium]
MGNSNRLEYNSAMTHDHSSRFDGYEYVYPVISRRARGLSIGVNLSRETRLCSFRCVYCQVAAEYADEYEVAAPSDAASARVNLTRLESELRQLIADAVAGRCLTDIAPTESRILRDIALSGDGEPTLSPDFVAVCSLLARLRSELAPTTTKLILITNAAHLDRADVLIGIDTLLANAGEVWGKLDAGYEASFRRLCVPRGGVTLEKIVNNLTTFAAERPLVVQTCLCVHGEQRSLAGAELDAYIATLQKLQHLLRVQLYTTARRVPTPDVFPMPTDEVATIAERIRQDVGVAVETFA